MPSNRRVFDECRAASGITPPGGAASVTILIDLFSCMRERLAGTGEQNRRAVVDAIAQAIATEPGLATLDHDRAELQKVLETTFAGTAYTSDNPISVAKVGFLDRVNFVS